MNVICIVVLMIHNSVTCIDLFCFLEIVTSKPKNSFITPNKREDRVQLNKGVACVDFGTG